MSLPTQKGNEQSASLIVSLPDTWYVYLYLLPDDTVFYVGKGKGCRLFQHEYEAASGCGCRKCTTIREIWASGSPVKKRIVFETFVETEAFAEEARLIQEYSGKHLTNTRIPIPSTEVREDITVSDASDKSVLSLRASAPDLPDAPVRIPPHQEYADMLRETILAGCYEPEGRLPSIGNLANRDKVSLITATMALAHLMGEKLIESRGRAYYTTLGRAKNTTVDYTDDYIQVPNIKILRAIAAIGVPKLDKLSGVSYRMIYRAEHGKSVSGKEMQKVLAVLNEALGTSYTLDHLPSNKEEIERGGQ